MPPGTVVVMPVLLAVVGNGRREIVEGNGCRWLAYKGLKHWCQHVERNANIDERQAARPEHERWGQTARP
jgi:hypothetical protein